MSGISLWLNQYWFQLTLIAISTFSMTGFGKILFIRFSSVAKEVVPKLDALVANWWILFPLLFISALITSSGEAIPYFYGWRSWIILSISTGLYVYLLGVNDSRVIPFAVILMAIFWNTVNAIGTVTISLFVDPRLLQMSLRAWVDLVFAFIFMILVGLLTNDIKHEMDNIPFLH